MAIEEQSHDTTRIGSGELLEFKKPPNPGEYCFECKVKKDEAVATKRINVFLKGICSIEIHVKIP